MSKSPLSAKLSSRGGHSLEQSSSGKLLLLHLCHTKGNFHISSRHKFELSSSKPIAALFGALWAHKFFFHLTALVC